ncbi:bifunctional DNA primase/polymerase [Streptomyces fulvoviolaceus]|uniref:bifunctional DNA primase/polymerase n=1 Tax=Streptomyces fulvoviolaceus TaxID=285535 RepID=UPI0004CB722F|nr:bifunctional DNA primase/polymerase [Streptomyces fulvoviolaceus]MCT9079431.1 bifunctional DNA primase/polymerase [Streptomyces fulvoviolaceus]
MSTRDEPFSDRFDISGVTSDGAAWLASAGTYPRSTLALWEERPGAPVVLPCGSAFDIVSAPAIFGRRMLDRLWDEGPGSGPVAALRGRMLLFAAPGTAQRLPSLLHWEEFGRTGSRTEGRTEGRTEAIPPLLCHGTGDAVTVPAPIGTAPAPTRLDTRWVVAPDTRHPWLPGTEILLWAAVRAARAAVRISIFPPTDQDAKVYDVSRRR